MINRYTLWIVGLLTTAVYTACSNHKLKTRPNEISKISFASGGCFGPCPILAIEVDSSLNYKYYGGEHSEKKGYLTGRISPTLWDTINIKFEEVDFKHLDTAYQFTVDDLATQTSIFYSNKRKIINAQSSSLPKPVSDVLLWLMNSYKRINLTPSKDTIGFGSRLQYLLLVPPPPPFKNFRVPRVEH